MSREKTEALYLIMLNYANHIYPYIQDKKDEISKLVRKFHLIGLKIKPRKTIDQQITRGWFMKFAEIETKWYETEDVKYAPEINIICLVYYLVGEHRFADLIAKYSLETIRKIHSAVESEHRQLVFEFWNLIDTYESSTNYKTKIG